MRYRIIGFSGLMGSGKTTAVNRIMDRLGGTEYSAKIIKFAAPLYDIQDYVYRRTYRELKGTKDRKLLQFIGTDWGRDIDKNMWLNIWELDVKHSNFFSDTKLIVLADDVRFDNEADKIIRMGGAVINIDSSSESRGERIPLLGTSHSSEKGIDGSLATATIYNNSTLEVFLKNVDALFETLQCGNSA